MYKIKMDMYYSIKIKYKNFKEKKMVYSIVNFYEICIIFMLDVAYLF